MGFETAKRGLMANQKGLDITGHNLTNVNTRGYTRQRVDFVSVTMSGQNSRYPVNQAAFAGQGVNVNGVSQIRNAFLDKRFREECGDVGYYDQSAAILSDVELALDEIQGTGLQGAMKSITEALQNFSSNADQVTHANIVLTSVKNLTQILHQFDTKLNNIAEQQKFDLNVAVNDVNSILTRIANLNKTISDEVFTNSEYTNEYYGPNELLDERNLLLDELSTYGALTVYPNKDGSVKVEFNGKTVVEGSTYDTLELHAGNTVSLTWQSSGKKADLPTGSLKAYVNMLNGRGTAATGEENFSKGIPYFKDKIDAFAQQFARLFNQTVPDCDDAGTPGHDPHDPTGTRFKALLQGGADGTITAGSLTVTDVWNDNPGYIIPPGCVSGGEKNNPHILALKNRFNEKISFGEFEGTFGEYVNFYNTTIGQEATFYSTRLKATAAIADNLLDNRDAISGVSPDEEGTNLMLYDKAYKAIGRLMTVMDEALDVLINRTGMVGR